jgi:hypothetical protein
MGINFFLTIDKPNPVASLLVVMNGVKKSSGQVGKMAPVPLFSDPLVL